MEPQLYRIQLHGSLAATYGTDFTEIYAISVRDAFSGLVRRFGEGFKQHIIEGAWHITAGKRKQEELTETDYFLTENVVELPAPAEELHVFPCLTGAGRFGAIILGVVLIVIAIVLACTGWGAVLAPYLATTGATLIGGLAVAGVVSILSGVVQLLTAPSNPKYQQAADQKQSFVYNGAINNTEQGVPVPLVYGRHYAGSTVISASLDVEQLDVGA